jgi:hypothetical protein
VAARLSSCPGLRHEIIPQGVAPPRRSDRSRLVPRERRAEIEAVAARYALALTATSPA